MTTSALGQVCVRLPPLAPAGDEAAVLDAADAYREKLAGVYQGLHDAIVRLRDEHFPALWEAMTAREFAAAAIYAIESHIKAHHSDVRDRNAVTDEQRERLAALRDELRRAKAAYSAASVPWKLMFRAHDAYWHTLADWKNVKDRAKRREMYAKIVWPTTSEPYIAALDAKNAAAEKPVEYDPADIRPEAIAAYGQMEMLSDLAKRELDERFATVLHSAIRAEIIEATQPKLGKDSPGIRYRFGRQPEVRPWEKLSLHFPGGLTVAKALAASKGPLRIRQEGPTLYVVTQQIGTSAQPRLIEYVIADIDLPRDATIMRWTYAVRSRTTPDGRKWHSRFAIPVCSGLSPRQCGEATCAYKLSWTRTKEGVQVAHFWGPKINERLIVPQWVVTRIEAVAEEQTRVDTLANAFLCRRGAAPQPGGRQGMEALASYCAAQQDSGGKTILADCQRAMAAVRNDATSARNCIVDIYRNVARRIARQHGAIVHDELQLAKLKRYDTRDLLKEDKVPAKSREILHAVSPGKLRLLLKQSGMAASKVVVDRPPADARETDWFTSYVQSLGVKTGNRSKHFDRRSQKRPLDKAGKGVTMSR